MNADPARRVRDCLMRFEASRDMHLILDPDVLAAARQVFEEVRRGARDPFDDRELMASPLWVIGTYHVFRYTLLPQEDCLAALQEAAECFLPLYQRDPALVPSLVVPIIKKRAGQKTAGGLDGWIGELMARLKPPMARGDVTAIRRVLDELRAVLGAIPDPGTRRAELLSEMAAALTACYEAQGDAGDLDQAVILIREADGCAPAGYRYRTASMLCSLLADRYISGGDEADIVQAFSVVRRALREAPAGNDARGTLMWALSRAHKGRFARSKDPHRLDAAIARGRQASGLLPAAQQPQVAAWLGRLLLDRFAVGGGSPAVPSEVADAVSIVNPASPQHADVLWSLATQCQLRYFETSRAGYLDAGIACVERIFDSPPKGHPGLAAFHSGMSQLLTSRFDHGARAGDLDRAVDHGYRAIGTSASDASVRPLMLRGLASALRMRAELRHSQADLDEAAAMAQRAQDDALKLGITDEAIPAELASVTAARYQFDGNPDHLRKACELAAEALRLWPEDAPGRPALLGNLSDSLRARFRVTGDSRFLDEAISLSRQAVDTSEPGSMQRIRQLDNLALGLRDRYELRRVAGDLDDAIASWQEAGRAGRAGDLDGRILVGLAGVLLRRHERSKRRSGIADLDDAIDCSRRALDSGTLSARNRCAALSHLAGMLNARFKLTGDTADREDAVARNRQALTEIPTGSPSKSDIMHNHIQVLPKNDRQDIERALDIAQTLGRDLPHAHPRHAHYLDTIARLRYQLFGFTSQQGDLDAAVEAWRTAAHLETAPAHVRASAARSCGRVLALHGDAWSEALASLALAVGLLPQIIWRGMDRLSQEEVLDDWPLIASDAAACAIQAGRPQHAVELLEQGRTLLWGHWLGAGDALSELRGTAPDLAERLTTCRTQLQDTVDAADLLGVRVAPSGQSRRAVEQKQRAARMWEETLAEVRALPGYERFLLPRSFAELQAAASEGPVCIINVSAIRCDALVVGKDGIRVIALPDLSFSEIGARAVRHLEALRHVPGDNDPVSDTLEWLWDTIAGPVLDALESDGISLTRVWWCPTGPLTLLPLHAAGHYRDGTSRSTTFGRVISSYAPSLSMLIRARRPATPAAPPGRMLAVGMPDPPVYAARISPLPSARREIDAITRSLGGRCDPRVGDRATRSEVVSQLPLHPWVHFACHGGQNIDHPALGALYLHDAPLRITEIGALDIDDADFAYLSACDTGMGGALLFDEAINMATAFHYAGYRHVIGTLWAVGDVTAAHTAEDVYRRLAADGELDFTQAAAALHEVARALADRYAGKPRVWAGYLHIGP